MQRVMIRVTKGKGKSKSKGEVRFVIKKFISTENYDSFMVASARSSSSGNAVSTRVIKTVKRLQNLKKVKIDKLLKSSEASSLL